MQRLLAAWRSLLNLLATVERLVLIFLIANIVLNITAQVISRYAFGRPLVWVEEIAIYSFIWATFVGAALGLKYSRHVKIETFVSHLPLGGAALLRALVFALILGFSVWMLPFVWTNAVLEMKRGTISLPFDAAMGWFFSVPLMVGLSSIALTAAYRLLDELNQLAGRAPQPPITGMPEEEQEDEEAEKVLVGDRS
ncbi:TRAP transporter small permease [Aquibaculum sediminis]|uniref:TRAP transporter small permease n=1 Tax=Aquibaculum sediminis TaxID=3231907 RepID=UPI0034517353